VQRATSRDSARIETCAIRRAHQQHGRLRAHRWSSQRRLRLQADAFGTPAGGVESAAGIRGALPAELGLDSVVVVHLAPTQKRVAQDARPRHAHGGGPGQRVGLVLSVAVRLVVDHEREIAAFVPTAPTRPGWSVASNKQQQKLAHLASSFRKRLAAGEQRKLHFWAKRTMTTAQHNCLKARPRRRDPRHDHHQAHLLGHRRRLGSARGVTYPYCTYPYCTYRRGLLSATPHVCTNNSALAQEGRGGDQPEVFSAPADRSHWLARTTLVHTSGSGTASSPA
jgi:hypothetical protein